MWLEKYNNQWYLKFGGTRINIWDRYGDAGTVHLQQIACWKTDLWDKDFEKLLHEKFNWGGEKEENDLYSEETYLVKN